MSDLRKAADAAIYALRYGVKTINHLGGAIEAMPLHDAIESLRAALADPQPEPEHIGPVSNAMADRAEIDATLLESLPRRLLDVACRARSNECLFRDDELIEQAAHAIRGALLYAAPQAKQPQKERPDFIAGYTAGLADGKRCAERDAKEPPHAEPYCYIYEYDSALGLHREFYPRTWNGYEPSRTVQLYAAPQDRKPLTSDQITAIYKSCRAAAPMQLTFAREIERAHKIGKP